MRDDEDDGPFKVGWFGGGPPAGIFRERLRPKTDMSWLRESALVSTNAPRLPALIEGILPAKGVVGLIAARQSFKSFLALDLAFHVAFGADWFGRKVDSGPVVYIAAEDAEGMKDRRNAWFKAHDRFQPWKIEGRFRPLDLTPRLGTTDGDADRLIASLKHFEMPRLIAIDTVSKVLHGKDENQEGMIALMANAEKIASAFDCVVMLIHHAKRSAKGEGAGIRGRGASQFGDNSQGELTLERRSKAMEAVLTVARNKGCQEGERILLRLSEPVEIRHEHGKPVSSLVIDSAGPAPERRAKADKQEVEAKGKAKAEAPSIEDRVRALLIEHPLGSDRQLAEISGISRSSIQRWRKAITAVE
jgi:hypothetical protein